MNTSRLTVLTAIASCIASVAACSAEHEDSSIGSNQGSALTKAGDKDKPVSSGEPDDPGTPVDCVKAEIKPAPSGAIAKESAIQACSAKKLSLTDLQETPNGWTATCCAEIPTAPPEVCSWHVLRACVAEGALKQKASSLCAGAKLELRSVLGGAACKGGVSDVKVECCELAPVAAPPGEGGEAAPKPVPPKK